MSGLGLPEILIILLVVLVALLPIAAAIWGVVVLQRISKTTNDSHKRVEEIERLLRKQ
jgi:hypothetical protein